MSIFVVTFSYDASSAVLAALRPERYTFFQTLEKQGSLLASGQLLDGDLGDGMLLLQARDEDDARAILKDDPFVRDGHVSRLDIAAWNPTVGTWID